MPKKELPIAPIPSEFKPKDKRMDKLRYKDLPKLPCTMVQLGRVGSGKSSIMYSLLTEGYVYGKNKKSIFNEIIFYVGNKESNHALSKIKCDNMCILHEFDNETFEDYLDNLKAHQLERMEKGKPPLQVLICFDDMAGVQLLKKQKGKSYSVLERLLLTSRHEANCSVLFASQVYKAGGFTTPLCRNNVMCWTISNMSKPEMEKIAEDHSQQYSPKEFLAMYNKAMERPYNFITVDYRRPLNERIWERFSHPLTLEGVKVEEQPDCHCPTPESSDTESDSD
jgi:hypothetical protein